MRVQWSTLITMQFVLLSNIFTFKSPQLSNFTQFPLTQLFVIYHFSVCTVELVYAYSFLKNFEEEKKLKNDRNALIDVKMN